MPQCSSCDAPLSAAEARGDTCPICGGALVTREDAAIARSISLPKNWAADMDSLGDLLNEEFGAETSAGKSEKQAGASRQSHPTHVTAGDSARTENLGQQSDDNDSITATLIAGADDLAADDFGSTDRPAEITAGTIDVGSLKSELKREAERYIKTDPAIEAPSGQTPQPSKSVLGNLVATDAVSKNIQNTLSNVAENESPRTSLKLGESPASGKGGSRGGGGILNNLQRAAELIDLSDDLDDADTIGGSSLVVKPRVFRPLDNPERRSADYTLIELLGEGGMGKVFKAQQNSIDRVVAVKTLKAKGNADLETKHKFLSEAVVTGDLDHPNIVPIYDLGTDDNGELFYSMKRVVGTPWMDVISEKPLAENLDILMKVADAVAFAHSRGVIHRDLKPENVMLGEFGEVLVMDWGLALTTAQFNEQHGVSQVGGLGGTPAYMAPEMLIGKVEEIGPPSDVYLLGAILYEIITGAPPHRGRNAKECLMAVATNQIVPTDKSGELVDIALTAMRDLVKDRFSSVREFQEQIRLYQSHSESIVLSMRAEEDLKAAAASRDYQDFARALFGFQEAHELWEGNQTARNGVSMASIAYADAAHQKGDLDLAASLLDEANEVHLPLLAEIRKSQAERDARQQRLKTVRRVTIGLVAVVLVVVTGAFFWIRAEAKRAMQAEAAAATERDAAQEQRGLALQAKTDADAKRREAEQSEKKARIAQQEALQAKQRAESSQKKAEEEKQRAEEAKQAEEYEVYVAQIGLAAAKIEENAFDTAVELLKGCKPELRNWEWGRLMHLCSQSSQTFDAEAPVDAIDISQDGRKLVSGGWNGMARIWDLETGDNIVSLKHGGLYVHAVAFSPDGNLVATGGNDPAGFLQLWDARSGQRLRTFQGHTDAVLSVCFSSDGTQLLSSSYDKTARLWNVATGERVRDFVGHIWWVWDAAFSPDERRIVTASQDGTSIVWNIGDDVRSPPFRGHRGPVYTAVFTADGLQVVSGGYDNRILKWRPDRIQPDNFQKLVAGENAAPPEFEALDGHIDGVRSLALSRDGHLLASASHDNTVRIWNIQSAKPLKTFRGHASWVHAVAFSHDGRRLISGAHDNLIKVWSIAGYEEFRVLEGRVLEGHDDAVLSAAFSPDGSQVVTSSRDRTARTWTTGTAAELRTFEEGHAFLTSNAVFFPDGKLLATSSIDNTVRLWDFTTGTEARKLDETGRSGALAVSGDGARLLTGSTEKSAKLWEARTGTLLLSLEGHRADVTTVAFSSDGKWLFSGDARGEGRLWNAAGELQHVLRFHNKRLTAAVFLPGDRDLLTASGDKTVARWDVQTGRQQPERILKHGEWVASLAVSADGRMAVTSALDKKVRVWDLDGNRLVREVETGNAEISNVSISPDGMRMLTADTDNKVLRIWDLQSGEEIFAPGRAGKPFLDLKEKGGLLWSALFAPDRAHLLTLGGNGARLWDLQSGEARISFSPHGAISSARFSPDGMRIVTGSWDHSAKVWDAQTAVALLKLEGQHEGFVNCARFSNDGTRILTASDDRTAKLWNAQTGELIRTFSGHEGPIRSAEFSADDTLILTASSDKTARIWRTETGEVWRTLAGHEWGVRSAVFSKDARRIMTGSEDNTARIWSVETGAMLLKHPLAGHTASVTAVAFSPDGSRVLTASQDNTAKLWDAATGKEILTLSGHTRELTTICFSPDGQLVLTGSRDGTAILWPTLSWKPQRAEQ